MLLEVNLRPAHTHILLEVFLVGGPILCTSSRLSLAFPKK